MNAKTTATELPKATTEQKNAPLAAMATTQAAAPASPNALGPIKNAATQIASTPTADTTGGEGKGATSVPPAVKSEKKPKAPTKMEIASSIYLRMSKQKDVNRKQIVEQFVTEAKLSTAGASTYYQLIKAKFG